MKQTYHLKHSNFSLDPQLDWMCYFGREEFEEKLTRIISGKLRSGETPKIVVWGDWGLGKTQTLYHFMRTLLEKYTIAIYVECPEFPEKSGFAPFYRTLMEGLGKENFVKIVNRAVRQNPPDYVDRVIEETNFKHICKDVIPIASSEPIELAWQWVLGRLPRDKAGNIGVISEPLSVDLATKILMSLGRLALDGESKPIVFCVDEAHRLKNIQEDSDYEREYTFAFRKLFLPQVFTGYIFAIGSGTEDAIPRVFTYGEVKTRLSDFFSNLPPFGEKEVKEFVRNTIGYSRDGWDEGKKRIGDPAPEVVAVIKSLSKNHKVNAETYPFTVEALDRIFEYFNDSSLPENKKTPREISSVMTECASEESALKRGIVTDEDVTDVMADRQSRTIDRETV